MRACFRVLSSVWALGCSGDNALIGAYGPVALVQRPRGPFAPHIHALPGLGPRLMCCTQAQFLSGVGADLHGGVLVVVAPVCVSCRAAVVGAHMGPGYLIGHRMPMCTLAMPFAQRIVVQC